MSARTVAALLGAGLVGLSGAGTALAASSTPSPTQGSITSPRAGLVVGELGSSPVAARAGGVSARADLLLQAPGEPQRVLASRETPARGDVLQGTAPVTRASRNGTWTVVLHETEAAPAGGATTTPRPDVLRTFEVEVPPTAPAGVTVTRTRGAVRVAWQAGAEPDLTGYRVQEGREVLATTGCEAGRTPACGTAVDLPKAAPGTHTYAVTALRACPTCAGKAPLTASSKAEPLVVAAPTPSPTRTGGTGTATAPRLLPSGAGAGLAPALPTPSLAPQAPRVAPATTPPLPDGTFAPTLGYPSAAPAAGGSVLTEQAAPTEPGRRGVLSSLDGAHLARSVAAGLLLFLVGAHLRRWASSAG